MTGSVRAVPAVLLLLAGAACTSVAPASGPADEGPPVPTLAPGPLPAREEAAARALHDAAAKALAEGSLQEARASASRVVESYPGSRVSVDALWIRARAGADALEPTLPTVPGGDPPGADPEETARNPLAAEVRADLERLLAVLPTGDPRVGPARLTQARVLVGLGEVEAGLAAALSLPPGDPAPGPEVADWVRYASQAVDPSVLGRVLAATEEGQPLRPVVQVARARLLRLAGDDAEARRLAGEAIAAGVEGTDLAAAEALAEDRPVPRPDGRPAPLGLVLPLGGSPAFQTFAQQVREGVEAAVEAWGLGSEVELLVLDDGGDPATAANLVRSVEGQGAVAVLGLLLDEELAAGAAARNRVPIISPTAYQVPAGAERILSLNAFDPGAADALAAWASAGGIRSVAVIHALRGSSAEEADRFARRFQEEGGTVLGTFPYEPGATFWEAQIRGAAALEPEAIVLPAPPEDLMGMAPQITFFGVDTLGIRVLGTSGWTDPQVLAEVDARHLDGVVVASAERPGPASPGYERFREAYESRFRRSLVEEGGEALGYDAASLVLRAIWAGAGSADQVASFLARTEGFAGATGRLSVEEGRVRRAHHMVCLDAGSPVAIPSGLLPEPRFRPYPPDDETGEIPEGPGRPAGYTCPPPPTP
ncbi:MAG: ABC transporter substrate-binding protein [Longimicrobiales bacterium]|nr:ABC transporter substrate-binding protein [Longimicrobiales bacterium]